MSENTFPIYKVDAIVNFYRTEVLTGQEAKSLTKNDFVPSPKPESVQRLYMRILQLLYRFRPECHFMVPLSENIQYPAFHEVTTSIMSVYLRMCQFLPMCDVYEFSLNDLLAPKTKRTMLVLSGIMNFIHFRKQRMEFTLEHEARYRSKMDTFEACSRGIKEAEKKIEILTTIPPEQQAEAKELSAAITELKAVTAHEYQEVNGINETIAEWKTQIAEGTKKLAQVRVDMSTEKEEIAKLKSQIVESPEELKSQMEKMRENLKTIKNSIKHTDESLVELQNKVQDRAQSEAEMQLMYSLLQDLESGLTGSKQRMVELQELTAHYEKQTKELKCLGLEEVQLKRTLGIKLDKESKQQIRWQKTKEMTEQSYKGVLGQCEQMHQRREEMAVHIQDIFKETQQQKAKMHSLREACNAETKQAQEMLDGLLASLDRFHKRTEESFVDLNTESQ